MPSQNYPTPTMGRIICLATLIFARMSLTAVQAVDPFQAEAKGSEVTHAAVDRITKSGIFSDDHQFLCRIAQVESRMGEDPKTYRAGYGGGIWQVDEIGFKDTQDVASHPELTTVFSKIQEKFGIDWKTVTWQELRKPFYSALAARIFLKNIPAPIPVSMDDQATYWKTHYDKNGAGTVADFLARAALKGDPHVQQPVTGSRTPLCYDVFGQQGDIYNFLTETSANMKVNAQLGVPEHTGSAKYMERMAVIIGQYGMYINITNIEVEGISHPWSSSSVIESGTGSGHVRVVIGSNFANVETSLVQVKAVKVARHLDFTISHIGAVGESASGILGDIAKQAHLVETEKSADLVVGDSGPTTCSRNKKKGCWVMQTPNGVLNQIIQMNTIDCIDC